jgi:ABC-type molybdenum transport system ATPase subunit/photorepair protein PhrA
VPLQVNIAVVGAEGAGKTALVSAVTGAPGLSGGGAAQGTTRWSPYSTHAQSKIRWWDSEGVSTWSNRKDVARLMSQLGQVERKHGFQFNLVIVLIRAWHKVHSPTRPNTTHTAHMSH